MTFVAGFPGKCACGEPIRVGDLIRSVDGAYVHDSCDDLFIPDIAPDMCTECFTERSVTGKCMCVH